MTQANIEIMDTIVEEMMAGKKLSEALKTVYCKRHVVIPYCSDTFDISILRLDLSRRTTNVLMRNGLETIGDIIRYNKSHPLMKVQNFGKTCMIEILEMILDLAWDSMSNKERVEFLMDTVERNQDNISIRL